ncbi:MAG: imelysin [Epsilonproteobacteria bacterium]|nr:imelysin [Campylobacterota bacterium]
MKIRNQLGALSLAAALSLSMVGCGSSNNDTTTATETFTMVKDMNATAQTKTIKSVLESYSNIALDAYTDSITDAQALKTALEAFTTTPTETTLQAAKDAWLTSRESYGQTEIFRLSNGPVDAEGNWVEEAYGALEGQINAWPLDENMIDYTIDDQGERTTGNIIDSTGLFTPDTSTDSDENATEINIATINVATLTALNENGGEANVATGYHAIEFLLWGQDQDYETPGADNITHGAQKAGERSLSDYTDDNTESERRKAYLNAAATKLVDDLIVVRDAWNKDLDGDKGKYRKALLGELTGTDADKNIAQTTALKDIFAGMGMFIKSELANERIAIAVLTPSEEDEHSCFSDNTHRDIDLNYKGFTNVLKGTYNGTDYGNSVYALLSSDEKAKIDELITSIDTKVAKIDAAAKATGGEHFDYQIKADSVNRSNVRDAKNDMRDLGDEIVKIASEFGISMTTADVTDEDETDVSNLE